MVQVYETFCQTCNDSTPHYNGDCGRCAAKVREERIRMWNAQDVATKLNDLRERMERLEAGPPRY